MIDFILIVIVLFFALFFIGLPLFILYKKEDKYDK